MMHSINDKSQKLIQDLNIVKENADQILVDIRKAAAEQGVSQQATYFKKAETGHKEASKKWLKATIGLAILMAVYSVFSLFMHEFSWLTPSDTYTSIQLTVSKTLIFAVISYMLYLSAKNFLIHEA